MNKIKIINNYKKEGGCHKHDFNLKNWTNNNFNKNIMYYQNVYNNKFINLFFIK